MSVRRVFRGLSNRQILLIIIIGIVFIGASFQVIEAQPEFCKSCHEKEFYYDSWKSSTHVDEVECLGCHTEPGVRGFVDAKIRGVTEFIAHITGDYEVPINPGIRMKNTQCLKCHPDAGDIPDIEVDARHDLHVENDVLCVVCHSRLVHRASGEPKIIQTDQCENCHDDHKDFSIQGKHALLKCSECHPGGVYEAVSDLCQDCHEVPFDHVEGVYSNCEACHSDSDWMLISFDHSTIELRRGHSNLTCLDCHQADSYGGLSPNCESCHDLPESHASVQDQPCVECHTVNGWSPVVFDHSFYELTGKHDSVSCGECHKEGQYEVMSTLCEDCHDAPVDHALSINETCELCHTTDAWEAVLFDHGIFPLTDEHQNVPCIDCHVGKVYDTASSLCEDCHDAPFDHAINMDANCGSCHAITGWVPAEFDHSAYLLTGAHGAVSCSECHTEGILAGTPTDCIGCHAEPSYHLGLSQNCTQCHSTSTFLPSTYRHPRIGEHYPRGEERLDCTDCHRQTYATYSCTGSGCHSTNNPRDD